MPEEIMHDKGYVGALSERKARALASAPSAEFVWTPWAAIGNPDGERFRFAVELFICLRKCRLNGDPFLNVGGSLEHIRRHKIVQGIDSNSPVVP